MNDNNILSANEGKNLEINIDGKVFHRIPVKTRLVTEKDNICDIALEYTKDITKPGDVLFISEKVVAITQNRIFLATDIKVSWLARNLAKLITPTSRGMGLARPETMEIAIRESGAVRMCLSAVVAVFTKLVLRRSGDFYRLVGSKARDIDGPYEGNVPPYDQYVILAPANCDQVCEDVSKALNGIGVAIVDVNDVGANILGVAKSDISVEEISRILSDNPLGQECQQTPIGIIRQVK